MLARELPREGVEVAHALHRDQERLVGGEPRVGQHRHLLAQVVLQLRDVDGVDRLPAAEVAPPLVDLLLERYRVTWSRHRQAPCGSGAADARWLAGTGTTSARQMPRSVASTACHCLRSSASCARPREVIRVVLATAAALRDLPPRLDVAEPLEPVQDGVEHPVRPLHAPSGQLPNALEDRVAVAVLLGQDRQDDRGRGSGDQVLVDLHDHPSCDADRASPRVHSSTIHGSVRYVLQPGSPSGTAFSRWRQALAAPCATSPMIAASSCGVRRLEAGQRQRSCPSAQAPGLVPRPRQPEPVRHDRWGFMAASGCASGDAT